jgi:hypothetical protein
MRLLETHTTINVHSEVLDLRQDLFETWFVRFRTEEQAFEAADRLQKIDAPWLTGEGEVTVKGGARADSYGRLEDLK